MRASPKTRQSRLRAKPEILHTFHQALAAHQENQLSVAKAIYQTVLDLDSKYYPALHMMGVLAAQSREFQKAIEFISKAIKVNPTDAPAHFNLPNAYMELGHIEKAIASYNNSIALKPNYAEAHANRGVALHSFGKIKEAITSFNKAIQLAPNYVDAYLNKGNSLRSLELLDEAEESFRHVLKITPNHSQALTALSKILLKKGQHKDRLRIQRSVFGSIVFDAKSGVLVRPKFHHA